MSPRGGGGSSSGGGGLSGGGSVSSTSGSMSGSMSGSGSRGSSSSYSGGTKGSKGSNNLGSSSMSGSSSKGGSSSYSGRTKGGKVPKGSVGGKAPTYHYSAPTSTYSSAAIPSRNNPLSFLTRSAYLKPHDQIQYMIGDTKQWRAAPQESYQSGSESAGSGNRMDAAREMPKFDPTDVRQSPHRSSGEVNALCGRGSYNFDASIGICCFVLILIILLGEVCHSFLGRKERKRSGKSQGLAKGTDKSAPKTIVVEYMGFLDSTQAEGEVEVVEETESHVVEIMAGNFGKEESTFGPQ
ncbi:MAG: hypothetical protein Q9209_003059 [Squamulea sp. 1 TL-2023]